MSGLNKTQHQMHLTTILLDIAKDSGLNSSLGFKGGTAAMLFYKLPRFSVDLDFDLIGKSEEIVEQMTQLLGRKYKIKDQSKKWNTLFWLLSYKEDATHVKVEVSTRDTRFNHYETKIYYGASMRVLSEPDMIAHKLIAMSERLSRAKRDLFDAHYFLSSPGAAEINYEIIKDRTGKNPHEFYELLLREVEKVENKNILDGLGELLTESQKDWARAKLKDELKNLIQRNIDLL
jgi:predicted nucleotidyltransferase component of viral defense system